MKTTAALLLATSLSFSLAACGDSHDWEGDGFDDAEAVDDADSAAIAWALERLQALL